MSRHELNAENLNAEIKNSRASIEPGYLEFLRDNDIGISELLEAHTVKRSESDTAHVVLKVQLENGTELNCCDCWSFRSSSADVREGEKPSESGDCPHVRQVFRTQKAKADQSQNSIEEYE